VFNIKKNVYIYALAWLGGTTCFEFSRSNQFSIEASLLFATLVQITSLYIGLEVNDNSEQECEDDLKYQCTKIQTIFCQPRQNFNNGFPDNMHLNN
jgi:hypothetical protein